MSKIKFQIPKDWNLYKLSDVATIQTGFAKHEKKEAHKLIETPYLRVANVQDGYLDLSEVKKIRAEESDLKRYELKYGDVLLVEGNGNAKNIGRSAIWLNEIPRCLHQNHIFVVRPNANKVLYQYLAWITGGFIGRRYFNIASKQTTLATLNSTLLSNCPVPVPSIEEQEKIVKIISKFQNHITLTEKLIAAKRRLKQGLMQQVFFSKKDNAWTSCSLNEVFERVNRKNDSDCKLVVTSSGEKGLIDQREFFNRRVASDDLRGYYLMRKGEFAYNRSSMKGYPYGAIKRLDRYEEAALSTLYVCFKLTRDDFNSDFFVYLFESGILNREIYGIVHEGARSHGLLNLSIQSFFNIKISVPEIGIQNKVAKLFKVFDHEIDLLTQYLERLQKQKRGLMQKLLTGDIRIPVSEDTP